MMFLTNIQGSVQFKLCQQNLSAMFAIISTCLSCHENKENVCPGMYLKWDVPNYQKNSI